MSCPGFQSLYLLLSYEPKIAILRNENNAISHVITIEDVGVLSDSDLPSKPVNKCLDLEPQKVTNNHDANSIKINNDIT